VRANSTGLNGWASGTRRVGRAVHCRSVGRAGRAGDVRVRALGRTWLGWTGPGSITIVDK
jgi:hypothetical protein